jgi:hypothetical protein
MTTFLWSTSTRTALAILLALHGAAHSVEAWRNNPSGTPYDTTILAGRVDLGKGGIRLVDALWLVAGLSFVAAAVTAVLSASWWPSFALIVAIGSLTLCVFQLPDTRMGVVINVILIAILIAGR